jgi:hypothetical protein
VRAQFNGSNCIDTHRLKTEVHSAIEMLLCTFKYQMIGSSQCAVRCALSRWPSTLARGVVRCLRSSSVSQILRGREDKGQDNEAMLGTWPTDALPWRCVIVATASSAHVSKYRSIDRLQEWNPGKKRFCVNIIMLGTKRNCDRSYWKLVHFAKPAVTD